MDYIHIRDLEAVCIVGVLPFERHTPRRVLITLRIGCDLSGAGQSDLLEDALDYRIIRDLVLETVQNSSDYLIERLAQRVADALLALEGVLSVNVCLEKPGALDNVRTVAVEIFRTAGKN